MSTSLDRWALARIHRSVTFAPIRFVWWDGFELPSTAAPAVATVLFKNRSALFGWVWDPELNFGEGHMSGAVEIRGDLRVLLEAIYRALTWAASQVATMFDETFVRAWQLYLAGSQASFTTGWMQLFQVLFARGGSNAIPRIRVNG